MTDLSKYYQDLPHPIWIQPEFIEAIKDYEETCFSISQSRGNQYLAKKIINKFDNDKNLTLLIQNINTLKCFPGKLPADIMFLVVDMYVRYGGVENRYYKYFCVENDVKMRQRDLWAAMNKAEDRYGITWIDGWKDYDPKNDNEYINPRNVLPKINIKDYMKHDELLDV